MTGDKMRTADLQTGVSAAIQILHSVLIVQSRSERHVPIIIEFYGCS